MRRSNATLLGFGALSFLILRGDSCGGSVGSVDGAGNLQCKNDAVSLQIPQAGCKELGDICEKGAAHEGYGFVPERKVNLIDVPSGLRVNKRVDATGSYTIELCAEDALPAGSTGSITLTVENAAGQKSVPLYVGISIVARSTSMIGDLKIDKPVVAPGSWVHLSTELDNPRNDSREFTFEWTGFNVSTGEVDESLDPFSEYITGDNAPEGARAENAALAKPLTVGEYRYWARVRNVSTGDTDSASGTVTVTNGVEAKIAMPVGLNVGVGASFELSAIGSRSTLMNDPIVEYVWEVEQGGAPMPSVPDRTDVMWATIYRSRTWHAMQNGTENLLRIATEYAERPGILPPGLYRARLTVRTQSGAEASTLQPFQVCSLAENGTCHQ